MVANWTPPEPSSPYTAVGVDIFAGGFSVGMSGHFKVLAHYEESNFGVDTFKLNFPGVPVYVGYDAWPDMPAKAADVIFCNPPCAPWSSIGTSLFRGTDSWLTNPDTQCTVRALEFGLRQRPLVWVDESVPNILKSGIVDQVARMWLDEGYAFTVVKFDPKFNGLPQGRRRVFLVAHSVEIPWAPPVFDGHLRTAGEALETAPPRRVPNYKDDPLSPDWIKALHLADEKWGYGANLREAWEELYLETAERHPNGINRRERVKGRPMIMIGRVDPARPSGVVIGVQVYIHPFEDRWLNGREVARLCGYPDDYQWSLEHDDGWTYCEVAKAVTPPAARWLASNLVLGLDARRPAVPTMREVTCWGQGTRLADNRLVFSQRELDDPRLTAVEEGAAS